MEYWRKPASDRFTQEALEGLAVDRPDEGIYRKVLDNWDRAAKPLDGMGRFEILTARIGAVLGTEEIDISRKAVVVMCSDNGIVEEGISQSGQEVTAAVARELGRGGSSVGKLAAAVGADVIPIDIGINREDVIPGVADWKIRRGTRNFRKEPAMTRQEAVKGIFMGIEAAARCKESGYGLIAAGEMGIGNTTTSSAAAAALLGCEAGKVTGRGAGLSDKGLARKRQVIEEALERYGLRGEGPLKVLETVGGYDIAGLAGLCIGGGLYHIPVVLDGVISMTAAVMAKRLFPETVHYLIPSHKGKEPAVAMLVRELGLEPVIDGNMALGEGTGAVMMMGLLDLALTIYSKRTTFGDIRVEPYERYCGR